MYEIKEKILQLKMPVQPNEKVVGEYKQSKVESAAVIDPTSRDLAPVQPESNFFQITDEVRFSDGALEESRKKAKEIKAKLEEQWKELEAKELAFNSTFIKFNKFLQNNSEKRERTLIKREETANVLKERNHEIFQLQQEYDKMSEIHNHINEKISTHIIYEKYLVDVREHSGQGFKNLGEFIIRYESLLQCRGELAERAKIQLNELEGAHSGLIESMQNFTLQITGLDTQLSFLRKKFEETRRHQLEMDTLLTEVMLHCIEGVRELFRVKESCWSLYNSLCARRKKGVPKIPPDDSVNQLLYIKGALTRFEKMNRLLKMGPFLKKKVSKP